MRKNQKIPKNLLSQLKIGGALVIPIGNKVQTMTRIKRESKNNFSKETFFEKLLE